MVGIGIDTRGTVKILLLENIQKAAVDKLITAGLEVDSRSSALTEAELLECIERYHVIGIRSKTRITSAVLQKAKNLICIACFCIGTDQVDVEVAQKLGIVVFNSPFSSTRSVAELIMGEIIMLARQLLDRSTDMHKGFWNKLSKGCYEIRGKTLGIVGYGRIGSQVSVMAESFGMSVIYYDIQIVMGLGNAKSCPTLESLLQQADFVTLHVPKTAQTHRMMGEAQFNSMKKGSYLLNASRGTVVDIDTLAKALESGKLAGATIDVFPEEPEANTKEWKNRLQHLKNVILSPHIGGSTEEAQHAIAIDVADKIIQFIKEGSTLGAVNFPEVELKRALGSETHRIVNVHENRPGVLKEINGILNENIVGQTLRTRDGIGYVILDVENEASEGLLKDMAELPSSIKTRIS